MTEKSRDADLQSAYHDCFMIVPILMSPAFLVFREEIPVAEFY